MLPLAFGLIVGACGPDSPHPVDRGPTARSASRLSRSETTQIEMAFNSRSTVSNSVTLEPTDTTQLIIPAGPHALGLQGVAGQCSVDPAMPLDVDIASQGTTPVAFAVNCPAVGASVTVEDEWPRYRSRTGIVSRWMESIEREPPIERRRFRSSRARGRRTITLTGLASNCAFHRPCLANGDIVPQPARPRRVRGSPTATTGVIEVSLSTPGTETGGTYQVFVDGVRQSQLLTESEPEAIFVPGGNHLSSNFRLPAHVRW